MKSLSAALLILAALLAPPAVWAQTPLSSQAVSPASPAPSPQASLSPALMPSISPSPEAPSEDQVTAKLSVDRNVIKIGDLINLNLEVTTPPEYTVEEPGPEQFLGDFEIRNTKKPVKNDHEGKIVTIYQFEIATFSTGKKILGPIPVRYSLSPQDRTGREVLSNKLEITIESVLPKDQKNLDIKDIKPPIQVDYPRWYYLLGALLTIIALLAIYLIVRAIRRRKESLAAERYRSPEEIAEEKLRTLRESALLREGRIKEYYSALSEILREYIENRYDVAALDRTTSELYRELKETRLTATSLNDIRTLLSQCDMVKFAKYIPEEPRFGEDFQVTEKILSAIRPPEVAEKGGPEHEPRNK
ncbi:MAG: hypothetical protein RDV48_09000 [Candidatus Eremiobacteraeota bacterium]|nr:hypothetical protein [Candidatus Eremiobacteraeota bacterium]